MLSNLIIRPPRALYDPNRALPGPAIRIGDSTYHRRDLQVRRTASYSRRKGLPHTSSHLPPVLALQLRGSNGHRLECSHYTPDEWPQPVREPQATRADVPRQVA